MSAQIVLRFLLPLVILTTGAFALVVLLSSGDRPPPPIPVADVQKGGCPATRGQAINDGFFQPAERRSENGVLSTTLKMSKDRAYIAKPNIASTLFEKSYPGPTLRVCQGDTLRIKLINDTKQPTNLHVHGLHVSPLGHGDNVLLDIKPGQSWQYEYKIPHDHPPGTYWYHPHRHGYTEPQVWAGMAGMLIVEGKGWDDLPGIAGARERNLVVMANQLKGDGVMNVDNATNSGVRMLINGRLRPKIDLAPGEVQRWRILNASADYFVKLRIPGQKLNVISSDGNALRKTSAEDDVLLGGGERVEILVKGTSAPARLETAAFKQQFLNTREAVLADINPVAPTTEGSVPENLVPFEDLRRQKVDRKRTITYSRRKVGSQLEFLVNGKQFGHHRVDQTMKLNDLEEWTIKNHTNEWHSFHIHINPFQVTKINGKAVDRESYEDTVPIPPNDGSVTLRQRYRTYTGQFVFHCHILGHEDGGMMSLVEIKK
ncbi:MAG: multicopper oxidase family protein [Solirubrobacteraceae bacterium]|nr:multicopper oxidase family protein [Solirubrobacteraceae bacterium]